MGVAEMVRVCDMERRGKSEVGNEKLRVDEG
jgi:hypothetical protein